MDQQLFASWMDQFDRAWHTNDPADIGTLVPDTFTWHAGPFAEVFRDRQTLVDHWVATVRSTTNLETSYELLGVCGDLGVARCRASFVRHTHFRVREDIVIAIRLDDQARCVEFREWPASESTPVQA